jgi:hypothetical protein
MRAPKTLARAIQRKRAAVKGYPKKPKSFDEMVNIPGHLTETSDKSPFLILNDTVVPNNSVPNAKRLLVFMSNVGRDILASSTHWYCDGTFKSSAATLFSQVNTNYDFFNCNASSFKFIQNRIT